MLLIISENDQIIGADNEFLQDSSLEELKLNFPSMSIFSLQSQNNEFEFELNSNIYSVIKHQIVCESQIAFLYEFKTQNSSIKNNLNQSLKEDSLSSNIDFNNTINESKNILDENPVDLGLNLDNETKFQDLDINLDIPTQTEEAKNTLDENPIR